MADDMKSVRRNCTLFQEVDASHGPKRSEFAESEVVKVFKCRTSNPNIYSSLIGGNITIVEDIRYYEYALGLGYALMSNLNFSKEFDIWSETDIIRSFINEIRLNESDDFALDIAYYNNSQQYDPFAYLYLLAQTSPEKSLRQLTLYNLLPMMIMRHEYQHIYLRAGLEEEKEAVINHIQPVFKIAKRIFEQGRSEDFLHLDQHIISLFLFVKQSEPYSKSWGEEVACDVSILDLTFGRLIKLMSPYGHIPHAIIRIVAEAHIVLLCTVHLLEYTRSRVLSSFSEFDAAVFERMKILFKTRQAYFIIGMGKIINSIESDGDTLSLPPAWLIEMFRNIAQRYLNVLEEARIMTVPELLEATHNMAADVMAARGVDSRACLEHVKQLWEV